MPVKKTTVETNTTITWRYSQEELKQILGLPEKCSLYWDEPDVYGPHELLVVIGKKDFKETDG